MDTKKYLEDLAHKWWNALRVRIKDGRLLVEVKSEKDDNPRYVILNNGEAEHLFGDIVFTLLGNKVYCEVFNTEPLIEVDEVDFTAGTCKYHKVV